MSLIVVYRAPERTLFQVTSSFVTPKNIENIFEAGLLPYEATSPSELVISSLGYPIIVSLVWVKTSFDVIWGVYVNE